MDANTHHDYFSCRGGGSSLTSGHAELVSASHNKEIPKLVRNDKYVNEDDKLIVGRLYQADKKIYRQVSKPDLQVAKIIDTIHKTNYNSNMKNYSSENKNVIEAHSKFLVPYCLSNLVSSKKAAFTLAEVLITLGIIGVVAAMTIPTLISNYQEKELVTRAKKALAQVNNAVNLARAENGYGDNSVLFNPNNTNEESMRAFAKYFKVQEICVNTASGSCKNYTYKTTKPMSSDGETYSGAGMYTWPRFLTMDGILIGVKQYDNCDRIDTYTKYENGVVVKDEEGNPVTYEAKQYNCANIMIDTNGKNKPNQVGRDIFALEVRRDTTVSNKTAWGGDLHSVVRTGKLYDTVDYTIGSAVED